MEEFRMHLLTPPPGSESSPEALEELRESEMAAFDRLKGQVN